MQSVSLSFRKSLLFLALMSLIAGTGFSQSAAPTGTTSKRPSASKKATTPARPLQLEPRALEILKATSDKLRNAHSLSFTAVELFEQLTRQDAPLGYTAKYQVTLQRPDKLRVLKPADGNATSFYYDGRSMIGYSPAENLLAVADAPPTIDATLEKAYQLAGIYVPFDDVIVTNPYGDLAAGLKHAYYVGQSHVVGETTTDIVAYAGDGVFVQLWVGVDDKLPRLMRAIFLDDPDHLRHELAFTGWKLDETVPADTFSPPAAASTAKRIPFAAAHPELPASAKAPAKAQPAKVKQ